MNTMEMSDNDLDFCSLGAREPSFNSLTDPARFSEISDFLHSVQQRENTETIQSSVDQKPDISIPNIADSILNTTTLYEDNALLTINEGDVCNLKSSETESLQDLGEDDNTTPNNHEYKSKRERNNIAVRKSRIKAKSLRDTTQKRVSQLKEENKQLEEHIKTLVQELKLCRSLFLQKGAPIPEQLQAMLDRKIL